MRYYFMVEGWTNTPNEVRLQLQVAIDRHAPFANQGLRVIRGEIAINIPKAQVGRDFHGDPWQFQVQGDVENPDNVRNELQRAIDNYNPTSDIGLEVVGMLRVIGQEPEHHR